MLSYNSQRRLGMARKKLTKEQITLLLPVTHNLCAMHKIDPTCHNYPLIRENHFFGEFAHISAAEPGGERYDDTLSDPQRNDIANIIVLCPNHHTIIDKKDNGYSIDDLLELKSSHEQHSDAPEVHVTDALIDEAEQIANININNTNINNGDGTQQVNTTTSTAPQTNYNAAGSIHVYSTPQPISDTAPPTLVGLGFYQPDQTLSMEVEITWLSVPKTDTFPDGGYEAEFLQFSLGSKHFVVLAQEIYEQITSTGKDAGGKYSMGADAIAQLLEKARLLQPDGLHNDNLLEEIRALSHTKSLRIVIGAANEEIALIPFEKLDASNGRCMNPIKVVFRGRII